MCLFTGVVVIRIRDARNVHNGGGWFMSIRAAAQRHGLGEVHALSCQPQDEA
jgi:hypothetical protein